jgi:hypothetical protein
LVCVFYFTNFKNLLRIFFFFFFLKISMQIEQ